MGSNEALVPKGLPHGERKKYEEAMDVAGLPKAAPEGAPVSPVGGVPPNPSPSVAGGGTPDLSTFDVLANREPSGVLDAPTAPTMGETRVAQTQNSAWQYYFGNAEEYLD